MPHQSMASSDRSQGVEATWSPFSLPSFDESDSEDGSGEPENQRQQSLASLTDDRRSFPEPELRDEDDDRRSFHNAEFQEPDAWSQVSMERSNRRSFPWLEFRKGGVRGERRSFPEPERMDEDDENRPLPAVDLHRTRNLSMASTSQRSSPELQDPEPRRMDGDDGRLSLAIENQPTSADSWTERRSFPALELPDSTRHT